MKRKSNFKKEVSWLLKEKYFGKPTKNFGRDIERLKKGEPLDYVVGFSEFLGCRIDLSQKPLIPRPETEFWIQQAIKRICQKNDSRKNDDIAVLDMFAGSGCIGIAILNHIKNSKVVFAEKDENLLEQIKINLELNRKHISNSSELEIGKKIVKCQFVQSDVFGNIRGKFDYIFANPPYIPNNQETRCKIQKSVLKYEPRNALFGGKDGLFYIKKFLKQAKSYLNPGGKIFMEFDPPQKSAIEKLLKKYSYKNWEFHKDQYDKWRWADAN